MIKKYRHEIKSEIAEIVEFTKDIPDDYSGGKGYLEFVKKVKNFHLKYAVQKREIRLKEPEIRELIRQQDNKCPITGNVIYFGDEVEIDHIIPLALGGNDSYENLQVLHKDGNRSKGARELP